MYPKLYAITDDKFFKSTDDLKKAIFLCLEYKIPIFQYRFKNRNLKQILKDFEIISSLLYKENGKLIIILNDYKNYIKDIFKEGFYIHGLHLGQKDFNLKEDKALLSFLKQNNLLFGLSTHNDKEIEMAQNLYKNYHLSYIGFGPIYKPISKLDHDPIVGPEKLKEVLSKISIPIVALGGITLKNIGEIIKIFQNYRRQKYDLDSIAGISLFFKENFEENFKKLKSTLEMLR